MANRDLQEMAKFEDRLSYLYFEKGRIREYQKAIAYEYLEKRVPIPIENLSLLLLGPGTTITHEAVKRLSESRCLVAWTGEEGVRFYSFGFHGTYTATNLLRQMEAYFDEKKRRKVIIRLYQKRFSESLPDNITVEKLRGMEGYRVRQIYSDLADEFGVEWKGRAYDQNNWNSSDLINRVISTANSSLYGLTHSAILAAGFSPAIGFIHQGKQLSFVYDIADLYKSDIILPLCFKIVGEQTPNPIRSVRLSLRDYFRETKFLKRIIPDIKEMLFDRSDHGEMPRESEGRDVAFNV
jgi:CRISP-associated protein Cas1